MVSTIINAFPVNLKGLYQKPPVEYLNFQIRDMCEEDIPAAAQILFQTFNDFNSTVGLPKEWESLDQAVGIVSILFNHPFYLAWVAEEKGTGRILGSNFLDFGDQVSAPGPLSITTDAQNLRVGRAFMDFFKEYCIEAGKPEIRFVQVGNNAKSFALYSSLGYIPRETLTMVSGRVSSAMARLYRNRYHIRRMLPEDADFCNHMYQNCVGVDRYHDIRNSTSGILYQPYVLLDRSENDKIAAYTTGYSLLGHGVYASDEAFQALFSLVSSQTEQDLVFHLMAQRYPSLLLWSIRDAKLKVVRQQILMSHGGEYRSPEGAIYFPGMAY